MASTYDEFGSVVEVVTAEELVEQQNREFESSGGADDDKTNPPTPGANPASSDFSSTTSSGDIPEIVITAKRDTSTVKKPGRRLDNPLGEFASYTYQITLYMVTPDAYNAFIQSGRRDINAIRNAANATAQTALDNKGAGAYIVAQSGGINDELSLRAPGFKYDYYIDDLKITMATSGKSSGTSSNVTNMTFTIIEPYGFSFVTKLKAAMAGLAEYSQTEGYSKIKGFEDCVNPAKQTFVLGIKFHGYDINGKIANSFDTNTSETFNPNGNGIFERFYDIEIIDMKFKLDGGATQYKIEAATKAPKVAFGVKKGRNHTGATATGTTVKEILGGLDVVEPQGVKGLLTQMNEQQQKLQQAGTIGIANQYNIRFIGDSENIAQAKIVSKFADPDKTKWPMAPINNLAQGNAKVEVTSKPNNNMRTITFKNDTSVMQMITTIISQSEYLEKALSTIFTTSTAPDPYTDTPDSVTSDSNSVIKWYNLASEVEVLGYDNVVQDWAYKITYIIQPYEVPAISSPYANNTSKYYGPHKRYEYWFTGKNKEILRYSQELNLSYFMTKAGGDAKETNTQSTGGAQVSVVPGMHTPAARIGKLGIGAEAQNSIVTSLVDPESYASAKISIIGDPDYLMQDSPGSLGSVYNQFYGTDGYSINANGGQVFIEIDFKEAIDYDHNKGTMSINDKILFWEYPKNIPIKGVSYQVIEVVSSFKGGKFTQEIDAVINTFPNQKDKSSAADAGAGRSSSQSAATDTRRLDIPKPETSASSVTGTQPTSPTKNANNPKVADDDAIARRLAPAANGAGLAVLRQFIR